MMSTRARLTVSYAVLLLATMVAFVVALLVGRSKSATQDGHRREAFRVADSVVLTLQSGQRLHPELTYVDSTDKVNGPQTKGTKELGDAARSAARLLHGARPGGQAAVLVDAHAPALGRRPDAVPPRCVSAHG